MENERNTQQYHQSAESQEKVDDQVEVKERGLLDTLLGRKKPEDQEKKEEEALVSGLENVKVSEPEKHHAKEDDHHEGGEKKESLLAKLHRTGSSSSSSSDEEEEVIDENGEVVKRKKKKGLKEKIKEKLPGHRDHDDVEAEHKPYVPAPVPASVETTHAYKEDDDHKAYIPASVPVTTTTHVHHHDNAVVVQKVEEIPEQGLLDKIKEKLPGGHKKPEDASAYTPAPVPAPVTTTHVVHHDDSAVVTQKVEETPEKGLLDKIKEKLPGGHKKPEDVSAAHAEDVSSPDGKDKKQGLLGKIMDKIPGYNKSLAEEEHNNKPSAAGEHKTSY